MTRPWTSSGLAIMAVFSSPAPAAALVANMLHKPVNLSTYKQCSANFTDVVGLIVPSHLPGPITKNYALSLRVIVNFREENGYVPAKPGGGGRGGQDGITAGLFGMQGQFSVGLSDSLNKLLVAIPGIPSLYHVCLLVSISGPLSGLCSLRRLCSLTACRTDPHVPEW